MFNVTGLDKKVITINKFTCIKVILGSYQMGGFNQPFHPIGYPSADIMDFDRNCCVSSSNLL